MSADLEAGAPPAPPRRMLPLRGFYWSVRREIWEYRSLFIAPICAAVVVLVASALASLLNADHLPGIFGAATALPPAQQVDAFAKPYCVAAVPVLITMLIMAVVYCLGAMNNERRDRSILFWKSLPVSDLSVVLAKLAVPVVVLPCITFCIILIMVAVMLLVTSLYLLGGGGEALFWARLPIMQMVVVLAYYLAASALWYAPVYGWLLLVSGWARRVAFLWAVLPWLGLCLLDAVALDSDDVPRFLSFRLGGVVPAAFNDTVVKGGVIDQVSQLDPVYFATSMGLWSGLGMAAVLIGVAVWLRRYREPL